jgi:hypothetical protein
VVVASGDPGVPVICCAPATVEAVVATRIDKSAMNCLTAHLP